MIGDFFFYSIVFAFLMSIHAILFLEKSLVLVSSAEDRKKYEKKNCVQKLKFSIFFLWTKQYNDMKKF